MGVNNGRQKRLKFNTVSSLTYQFVNLICNFVLPRLILEAYGSEANGLVNSIVQFLQVIGFLELGVGSVVQSALYKPLANDDYKMISQVVCSAQKFFRKIAYILLGYVTVLLFAYPIVINRDFGWAYAAFLIFSISISSFSQYYFGLVDSLLLTADQRGYIQYLTQTITVVLNTIACAVLIYFGASIHAVKLTTSLIFLIRPLVFRFYISKNYKIDRKIKYSGEPIKQKWNGIAQHISAVVLDGTDILVLTVLSTLQNVSVYSVYNMVVLGIKHLFMSLTNGVKALIGELWAKQEIDDLNKTFSRFEWLLHTSTVFIFGCTGVLIVPFVMVYTKGVSDTNYIQPLFAILLTAANAGHCLRLPYSVMILAGGHYKQTQSNYIIAAILNIVISVATVIPFGLIGVAIGTLVAMLYQTVWMAYYISKNLNEWPFKSFIKQIFVDIITVLLASLATFWIELSAINYISWIVMGFEVTAIWAVVILFVNSIFYRNRVFELFNMLFRRKRKNNANL